MAPQATLLTSLGLPMRPRPLQVSEMLSVVQIIAAAVCVMLAAVQSQATTVGVTLAVAQFIAAAVREILAAVQSFAHSAAAVDSKSPAVQLSPGPHLTLHCHPSMLRCLLHAAMLRF